LDASTCRARASRNRDDVSDNIAGGASSRIDLASDYVGRRARLGSWPVLAAVPEDSRKAAYFAGTKNISRHEKILQGLHRN
jgi:hypothetical protein